MCVCEENEVPHAWLDGAAQTAASPTEGFSTAEDYDRNSDNDLDHGWITSTSSGYGYGGAGHDESLGKIAGLPSQGSFFFHV